MRVGGNGQYGVTIFFVISGYLIASNIIRRWGSLSNVRIVDFYIMRAARILPGLLLLVGLLLLLSVTGPAAFVPPPEHSATEAAWYVLTFRYFQLVYVNCVPGMMAWGPTWSLSVEEIFYAVFPLACLLLRRRAIIALALMALIVMAPTWREQYGYFSVAGSSDALAMGCLLAMLSLAPSAAVMRLLRFGAAIVIAAAFALLDINNHFGKTYGISIVAAAAAAYILGSQTNETSRVGPLQHLGRNSYELYLFHAPVLLLCTPLAGVAPHFVTFPLTASLSVAAAAIIARFYTEPLNARLRASLLALPWRRTPSVTAASEQQAA